MYTKNLETNIKDYKQMLSELVNHPKVKEHSSNLLDVYNLTIFHFYGLVIKERGKVSKEQQPFIDECVKGLSEQLGDEVPNEILEFSYLNSNGFYEVAVEFCGFTQEHLGDFWKSFIQAVYISSDKNFIARMYTIATEIMSNFANIGFEDNKSCTKPCEEFIKHLIQYYNEFVKSMANGVNIFMK